MESRLLKGLIGENFDYLLHAGDKEFCKLSAETNKKFDMAEDEQFPCNFTGFSLSRDKNGDLFFHYNMYLKKLEVLLIDAKFNQFRSMCMRLAWLSHTRSDCLFDTSQL